MTLEEIVLCVSNEVNGILWIDFWGKVTGDACLDCCPEFGICNPDEECDSFGLALGYDLN